jgi:hypothetical protein
MPAGGAFRIYAPSIRHRGRNRLEPRSGRQDVTESDGSQRLHKPDEIAERLGGITQKTLTALIRSRGLETTTLGYAPPSRKGGPKRKLWAMTDDQLSALLSVRRKSV